MATSKRVEIDVPATIISTVDLNLFKVPMGFLVLELGCEVLVKDPMKVDVVLYSVCVDLFLSCC